jgi:prepilin peptidase CpaA
LGWSQVLDYALLVSVLGGAITIAFLAARRVPLPPQLIRLTWIARLHDAKAGIPYGLALAMGGLWIYPNSQIFTSAF